MEIKILKMMVHSVIKPTLEAAAAEALAEKGITAKVKVKIKDVDLLKFKLAAEDAQKQDGCLSFDLGNAVILGIRID